MRKLQLSKTAEKSLRKILSSSPEIAKLILAQLEYLCEHPTPKNTKKLSGYPFYRSRISDYRLIYEFDDAQLAVYLIEHRRRAYEVLRRKYS